MRFTWGLIAVLVIFLATSCSNSIVCDNPYIHKGTDCCLDQNNNRICDTDETHQQQDLNDSTTTERTATQPPVSQTCEPPLENINGTCCADDNTNNICDSNEQKTQLKLPVASQQNKTDISQLIPAIVTITSESFRGYKSDDGEEDYDDVSAQGSGFFVTNDGFAITNSHVIINHLFCAKGMPCVIRGHLSNGNNIELDLVAFDEYWDIALLKSVKGQMKYSYLPIAKKSGSIGDTIYILGAPMGQEFSIGKGIISQKDRKSLTMSNDTHYSKYLQTDAALNPGSSGGPMVNEKGEVVGLSTFGYTYLEGLNYGLQSEQILSFINTVYFNTSMFRSSPKRDNFKSYTKNVTILAGKANVFTRETIKKVELSDFTVTIENKKIEPITICYNILLISNQGYLVKNITVEYNETIKPKSQLRADHIQNIQLSSDRLHFYEVRVEDCGTQEIYGLIYGIGSYLDNTEQ